MEMIIKSEKDFIEDLYKQLGITNKYAYRLEYKRSTSKEIQADLNVYSITLVGSNYPVGTVVIQNNSREIESNKIIIGIGSNPRKVTEEKEVLIKLEPTRLNTLLASKAKYLIQFDLSPLESKNNEEFRSLYLKSKSKGNDVQKFTDSIVQMINTIDDFLRVIKKSKYDFNVVLGYGEMGYEILQQTVNYCDQERKVGHIYYDILSPYRDRLQQFVMEQYPPHASSNYGSHKKLSGVQYFDDYFLKSN